MAPLTLQEAELKRQQAEREQALLQQQREQELKAQQEAVRLREEQRRAEEERQRQLRLEQEHQQQLRIERERRAAELKAQQEAEEARRRCSLQCGHCSLKRPCFVLCEASNAENWVSLSQH